MNLLCWCVIVTLVFVWVVCGIDVLCFALDCGILILFSDLWIAGCVCDFVCFGFGVLCYLDYLFYSDVWMGISLLLCVSLLFWFLVLNFLWGSLNVCVFCFVCVVCRFAFLVVWLSLMWVCFVWFGFYLVLILDLLVWVACGFIFCFCWWLRMLSFSILFT